jgi:putative tryptophan/tyrosine transport system substrate-binding protein
MRRRALAGLVAGAAAWPLAARAQVAGKSYRIAILHQALPVAAMTPAGNPSYRFFFAELGRRGYAEGQNLAVARYSGVGNTHLGDLLRSVAATRPDAMFVVAMDTALAATPVAVPIVQIGLDPIAFGTTTSLAHPDRNITGVVIIAGSEIYAKHLELLREAVPGASRVALLAGRDFWDHAGAAGLLKPLRAAAGRVGVTLIPAVAEPPYGDAEYRQVFAALGQERPDGMIVTQSIRNNAHPKLIVDAAANARLPAIYPQRSFVDQGGLMSYGSGPEEAYRRAADDIAQILGGARPADIPYYRPSRFKLVINLKTAAALGLVLPQLLLAAAADTIE